MGGDIELRYERLRRWGLGRALRLLFFVVCAAAAAEKELRILSASISIF